MVCILLDFDSFVKYGIDISRRRPKLPVQIIFYIFYAKDNTKINSGIVRRYIYSPYTFTKDRVSRVTHDFLFK